jgi:phosphate transport system protein
MSHYEERLERDLNALLENIGGMATQVQANLESAVRALQHGDHQLAAETILADHPINRKMREIDAACHAFVAVHLPSGRHLRLLSSFIRINIALERIGDYATTIARAFIQLPGPPSGRMAHELDRFSGEVKTMLEQSIKAFGELDQGLARGTMVQEREMEFDLDGIYAELVANQEQVSAPSLLNTFTVFTNLKRVADQAKNICEDIVFAETGETKEPKVYNILFLDRDNSCLGQMAEALARNAFPGSGSYASAGVNPAAQVDRATVEYLADKGIDIASARPTPIDFTEHELAELHLVVSLQGPVSDYLPQLPFHTTGMEWSISEPETPTGAEQLQAVYRELRSQISDLMHQLRGDNAP